MTVEAAVNKFRNEMEDLGLGVTMHVPGHEPIVVTEPKETAVSTAAVQAIPQQLTFEVGGELAKPTGASIAITGMGAIRSQLYIDDDVTIQVIDAGGEIVATFDGSVAGVSFKKHDATETANAWIERQHKIKLGDRVD